MHRINHPYNNVLRANIITLDALIAIFLKKSGDLNEFIKVVGRL
jgi:hypothetical protein